MKDLSILIPANNEIFLKNTIEDILAHIEADTEVIATLDGKWAEPAIEQHPRVNIIYVPVAIGQRAATNIACNLAHGKYVMKVDAHCAFDQGFDRKMLEAFKEEGDDVTMVPTMRNLWAFDWKCYHCGWKQYQGAQPKECGQCKKDDRLKMKIVWIGKPNPQSNSYCFDSEPHFQYFNDYTRRQEYKDALAKNGLTESMSIQGSAFMLTKERYQTLNICDEEFGNWGNQGIEVACKTWLSGGRVLINHNTWYAHMFRTQTGWKFPWESSERQIQKTKKEVWESFFGGKWDKQTKPVSWLIEKFMPIQMAKDGRDTSWTPEKLSSLKVLEAEKMAHN